MKKYGRFKYLISVGWVFTTVGTGLLCVLSPSSNASQRLGFQIVVGLGAGTLFPTLQLASQAPQSERNVAMAVAVFTFIRSFGQTFGVAMGGVIFQNEFDEKIADQISNLPPQYVVSGSNAAGFVPMLASVPVAVRVVLQYVYADSLRIIWYVMIPFSGVGLLVSFLAKDLLLVQKHTTDQSFEDGSQT